MNLEKVKITGIWINDKDKEGKKFISSRGKGYWKVAILCDKYPKKYLSSLIFDEDDERFHWQIGDEIEIVVEKNGDFLNFKVPTRLDRLEIRVKALEEFMINPAGKKEMPPEILEKEPEKEIQPEDLPF
jgi:hypothetical protein